MSERSPEENSTLQRNIVRKLSLGLNLSALYPPHHPEVRVSVSAVQDVLREYFEVEKEFSLGVGIKGWIIQGTDIARENVQFGATARELHRRGVSAMTLYPDLGENTLLHFFQLATLSLEEVDARGGLIKLVSEVSLPSINLFALDYDRLLNAITTDVDSGAVLREDEWESIVNRFLADPKSFAATAGKNAPRKKELSSEELALLLNQIYKTTGRENTDKLSQFLQTLGDQCLSDKNNPDTNRDKFCQLVSQLNPEILQKTAGSLKNIHKRKDMAFNDRLLSTLNLFSSESVHHSRFLRTEPEKVNAAQMQDWHPEDTQALQEMFENRPAEQSASGTYKASLNKMIEHTRSLIQNNANTRLEKFHLETSPDNIKIHTLRILLDLLDLEKVPVTYLKLVQSLPAYFDLLVKTLDLPLLLEVCLFLTRHAVKKEDDLIRSSAEEMLANLFTGDVIFQLCERWLSSTEEDEANIRKILERLNASQVVTTLKLLLSSRDLQAERQKICALLSEFLSQDLAGMDAELNSQDSTAIGNAIFILSQIPNEDAAVKLGSLLTHPDKRIHEQALDALIEQGTQKSMEYLLSVLFSLPAEKFSAAVRTLAGNGKKPVMDQLKEFLTAGDFFERTYARRLEIIAAIGEFRNEHAIPMVGAVFQSKPFFRAKKNNSLRAAILNALSKIGTRDALIALNLLKGKGDTMIQMTGKILLEGRK